MEKLKEWLCKRPTDRSARLWGGPTGMCTVQLQQCGVDARPIGSASNFSAAAEKALVRWAELVT